MKPALVKASIARSGQSRRAAISHVSVGTQPAGCSAAAESSDPEFGSTS